MRYNLPANEQIQEATGQFFAKYDPIDHPELASVEPADPVLRHRLLVAGRQLLALCNDPYIAVGHYGHTSDSLIYDMLISKNPDVPETVSEPGSPVLVVTAVYWQPHGISTVYDTKLDNYYFFEQGDRISLIRTKRGEPDGIIDDPIEENVTYPVGQPNAVDLLALIALYDLGVRDLTDG